MVYADMLIEKEMLLKVLSVTKVSQAEQRRQHFRWMTDLFPLTGLQTELNRRRWDWDDGGGGYWLNEAAAEREDKDERMQEMMTDCSFRDAEFSHLMYLLNRKHNNNIQI